MTDAPTGSMGAALIAVAFGAAALAAIFWLSGAVLRVVPLSRRRRQLALRAAPVLGATLGLLYLVAAVGWLFGPGSALPPAVAAVLLAVIGWVAWPLSRDVLAGVSIKAGRVCSVGDAVDTGSVSGRVTRMGLRVLTLETTRGEEAIVPYGAVAMAAVRRRPVLEGLSLHAFRVEPPRHLGRMEVERRVREAALHCHWASVVRQPELSIAETGALEITVFSLDAQHAPAVEAAVRRALEGDS